MKAWTLTKNDKGIATLVFDLPGDKVNKFTEATLDELSEVIDQIGEARALVIRSGKKGTFIAGADLTMFEKMLQDESLIRKAIEKGHATFSKIAALPYPTIAMIDGACLGGGCELALSCDYRIATDNPAVAIGLPETQLGIIPGWGGTQRLPRLVGLQEGLGLILSGKRLDGKKAWKIGLVDRLLPAEFQDEQLPQVIDEIISGKLSRKKRGGVLSFLLEKNPLGRALLFHLAKKEVLKKTKGHYPAPLKALEVVENSYTKSLEKGLKIEQEAVIESADNEFKIAPNLIKVFFGTESLKKQETPKARKVNGVGVIGAGVMGSGIAWLASSQGHRVRLKDINFEALAAGLKEISQIYKKLIEIKKMKKEEANRLLHKISYGTDSTGFKTQDLVIEAATENLSLKKKLFAELEENLPKESILATNTSSLRLKDIEEGMKYPSRLVGMHFFNPVNRMPLVEVVKGSQTSEETLDTAIKTCLDWKKYPIVVKDCAGFLVNRVFSSQANEVMHLVEEGVSPMKIEELFLQFGWPMGPFELADVVGNDVGAKVFKVLHEAYGERMAPPALVPLLVEKGLIGKKTGRGFYLWKGKKKVFNPEAEKLIKQFAKSQSSLSDNEILDRVHFVMINEAARCLEEGVVRNAKETRSKAGDRNVI